MKKTLGISIFAFLSFSFGFSLAPSFEFFPVSGSILKLHCNYNVDVMLNPGGQRYNAFATTVKFNPSQISGSHKSVNFPFTDNINGFITGGYLYRAYGALPGGQWSNLSVSAATFGFKTILNITSTILQFTDLNGDPIVFGPSTTADGSTINGYDVSSADILTAAYDARYFFLPYPCVEDTDAPIFVNMNPGNGAYYVFSGQRFSALVYDWIGAKIVNGPLPLSTNSTIHYRYSGLDINDLDNYQKSPVTVDNQEGVNSGTVKIVVSCPLCTNFGGPYVLSGSDLHLLPWTGDSLRHRLTWQNKDRGYVLRFDPPRPYEVEKLVVITLQASDNPNYSGKTHTGIQTLSFNAPRNPLITPLFPTSNATYVDRRNTQTLKFYFSDDWAGIDTGSIKITIPQIFSGIDILMTGYTYSGSDLIITLSGGTYGLGNSGSYLVEFTGKWNFASNTGIRITGFVLDLAGNSGYLDMWFFTRPSCADWLCPDVFQVYNPFGLYQGIFDFTGSLIVVTGFDLNSPYPYLTGLDGDILMCGMPYSGLILTGNIPITDINNSSVKGVLYTGRQLYITGLNFIVQDGVIVVLP